MRTARYLGIEDELDLFMNISKNVILLETWFKRVDPNSLARLQDVSRDLKEILDARMSKYSKDRDHDSSINRDNFFGVGF